MLLVEIMNLHEEVSPKQMGSLLEKKEKRNNCKLRFIYSTHTVHLPYRIKYMFYNANKNKHLQNLNIVLHQSDTLE